MTSLRSFRPGLAAAALLLLAAGAPAQPLVLPQESPAASVSQTIGITSVSVSYHRPSVKGRAVWGKLVPYGLNNLGFGPSTAAPWRAGANENTVFETEHDLKVGGKPLPAGRYGLHMILTEEGRVTVILSRDAHAWGSFFYEPGNDALRTEVQWEEGPPREQLEYRFEDVTKTSARLVLEWERRRIAVPLSVDTDKIVVASLRRELRGPKGFTYQSWMAAANYLVTAGIELPLALEWAEAAVAAPFVGERNFNTLSLKSRVLDLLGRKDEARTAEDEALAQGSITEVHQYGRQLVAAGRRQRALEVFQLNAQRHPDTWPVDYGLARGYSAVGDYAKALEALQRAQKRVPAGDLLNPPAIEANLEKLRQGRDIN